MLLSVVFPRCRFPSSVLGHLTRRGIAHFRSARFVAPVVQLNAEVRPQWHNHCVKRNIKVLVRDPPPPPPKPTKQQVIDRTLSAVKRFDRLPADKELTLDSNFMKDLGLDSLDHVEIIMQIEDEFSFEIPDGDAERLLTPRDIIQYICDREDVYE